MHADDPTWAFEAIANHDLPALQQYLQAGGDVEARSDEDWTLLMTACNVGSLDAVNALVARGADPNACEPDGRTALMEAVSTENIAIAETLLRAGADPNAITTDHETALTFSIVGHKVETCEMLLAAGANANDTRYDYPPLAEAFESANVTWIKRDRKIVRALIQHGADTDYCGWFGTILERALRSLDEVKVLLVLTTCTRINEPDQEGRRPLTLAKELGMPRVVQRLEEMGAVE